MRQQIAFIFHDEHAPHVKLNAVPLLTIPQIERRFCRNVEQLGVFLFAFDARVGVGQRRFEIVANVFVKFVVLFFGNVIFRARPQCRGLVDCLVFVSDFLLFFLLVPFLFLHHNRQRDVVGIFANDGLELPRIQKFIFAGTQMQNDIRATSRSGRGFQRIVTFAGRFPTHRFIFASTGAPSYESDFIGNNERRIKSDAELADQVRILSLIAAQLLKKFARAGFRDSADVLNHLIARHADAVVGNRDRARGFVEVDANF